VAQGLAFGSGLPVVGVSDLRAVAQGVSRDNASALRVLVCNDARMQEVYWACFEKAADGLMQPVGNEHVGPPAGVRLPVSWEPRPAGDGGERVVHGAGRGFAAYPELRRQWASRLAVIDAGRLPAASEIAMLAVAELQAGRGLPAEQALPVYLRDDVAVRSS
jgi:tRNA threonylcarbamoyladenosine biosynthesis protein TsaB